MRMIKQTLTPFKREAARQMTTARAGAAIRGKIFVGPAARVGPLVSGQGMG
jgi:hypothetical protein